MNNRQPQKGAPQIGGYLAPGNDQRKQALEDERARFHKDPADYPENKRLQSKDFARSGSGSDARAGSSSEYIRR